MKLACETCPFWTCDKTHPMEIGTCHHYTRDLEGKDTSRYADWWCSLHPAAPKPIYEYICLDPSCAPQTAPDGFEPVAVAGTDIEWGVLARRIAGYTKGGDDEYAPKPAATPATAGLDYDEREYYQQRLDEASVRERNLSMRVKELEETTDE